MSYLVLARKWRPTTFDEVIGQSHVTRTLKNAIELDRVAHALLFTGSRGVGKTSCARILAKALNCEQGPTIQPCGTCAPCIEIGAGSSVDVFEIDGASNNSVDQIREIRESVKFMPTRGKRKMYIIDEVHMLSTSAFNALLKTLEEPPDHVLFVFATTEPHKIPDTILSRCQRYDFKRISEQSIIDALVTITAAEEVTVESGALQHIAREAQGGMRDSLSLLDQVIAYCGLNISEAQTREVLGIADRQVFYDLTQSLLAGDGQVALEMIGDLFRVGLDLQKFAGELVRHMRDLMVVRISNAPERLVDIPAEEVRLMAEQVKDVDPARLHRLFGALMKGAEEVARSPFPKLALEMTLLRLCHQGQTLPLAEVLEGLTRLEAQLNAGLPATDGDEQGKAQGSPALSNPSTLPARDPEPVFKPTPTPGAEKKVMRPGSSTSPEASFAPTPLSSAPVDQTPAPPANDEAEGIVEVSVPAVQSAEQSAPPAVEADVPDTPATSAEPVTETKEAAVVSDASSKGFKRRSEEGDYDDFSAEPITALPPQELPRVSVKPRVLHIDFEQTEDEQPALEPSVEEKEEPASLASPTEDEPQVEWVALDLNDGRTTVEHFAHIVMQVRLRDPFLASLIEQNTNLIELTPTRLSLATGRDEGEALERAIFLLKAVLEEISNPVLEVCISACDDDDERLVGETLYGRKTRLIDEDNERRRAVARTHPGVRQAVDTLEAPIIDVQPR